MTKCHRNSTTQDHGTMECCVASVFPRKRRGRFISKRFQPTSTTCFVTVGQGIRTGTVSPDVCFLRQSLCSATWKLQTAALLHRTTHTHAHTSSLRANEIHLLAKCPKTSRAQRARGKVGHRCLYTQYSLICLDPVGSSSPVTSSVRSRYSHCSPSSSSE